MKLIVILIKTFAQIGEQVVQDRNSTGQDIMVRRIPAIQVRIMIIPQELIKDIISTLMHQHLPN